MACRTRSAKGQEFHFLIKKNIHLTRGYISRAFLYDQLFALLFIKHKREETVLDSFGVYAIKHCGSVTSDKFSCRLDDKGIY